MVKPTDFTAVGSNVQLSSALRIAAISWMPPSISPSRMCLTTALPTITPSACFAARAAASGVPMPNPMASGISV